jgi:hypothetical protein
MPGQILHVKSDTVADITDTNYVRPSDWNSAHAYTLQDCVVIGGNTTAAGGATSSISTGTLFLQGGNNITLSQNANSVTISAGVGTKSSYENIPGASLTNMGSAFGQSTSACVAFFVPEPISFSFLRLPCVMTTNSTAIATSASSNTSATGDLYSTWNAHIYSLGTGTNSKFLQYVTSGQGLWTFRNLISITNSTVMTISMIYSALAEGNGTTLNTSTSNLSTSNWPFSTTGGFSSFTGNRFIDINLTGSLDVGAYWLVVGVSTNTATTGGIAAMTNCNVRYSQVFGGFQVNSNFGIMGSTNLTSGGLLGCGSITVAAGATTSSLSMSNMSSSASNARLYFQLLRSA